MFKKIYIIKKLEKQNKNIILTKILSIFYLVFLSFLYSSCNNTSINYARDSIKQMDDAIGEYYKNQGKSNYNNKFKQYANKNGITDSDLVQKIIKIDSFKNCILTNFDKSFPLPKNLRKEYLKHEKLVKYKILYNIYMENNPLEGLITNQLKIKNDDINNVNKKPCKVCKNLTSIFCSRCKAVYYCNQDCQRKDWKKHKKICKKNINPNKKLLEIVGNGDHKKLEIFLNKNKKNINIDTQDEKTNDTALHLAIRNKDLESTYLISNLIPDINLKNNNGQSVYDIVSNNNYDNIEIKKLLLKERTSDKTTNNFGLFLTVPFRYPHMLESLDKIKNKNPNILIIGPGLSGFKSDKSSDYLLPHHWQEINGTSPALIEIQSLFPEAKIDIIDRDKNVEFAHLGNNYCRHFYKNIWNDCLSSKSKIQLNNNTYKKMVNSLQNPFKNKINFINKDACKFIYNKKQDIIIATKVFLTNYLTTKNTNQILCNILNALKSKGCFYIDETSLRDLLNINKFVDINDPLNKILRKKYSVEKLICKDTILNIYPNNFPYPIILNSDNIFCIKKIS